MSVFDKLHELKHSLVGGEHEQAEGSGEPPIVPEQEQKEGWSHKVSCAHLPRLVVMFSNVE